MSRKIAEIVVDAEGLGKIVADLTDKTDILALRDMRVQVHALPDREDRDKLFFVVSLDKYELGALQSIQSDKALEDKYGGLVERRCM